jgi:hypothetical protein
VPSDPFKPHDVHLEQGDIFADVPLIKYKNGKLDQKRTRAIITSDGCACEDYERMVAKGHTQAAAKLMLHVAPLRATKDVPEHRLEEIRSGEQLDYFYVYGWRTLSRSAREAFDVERDRTLVRPLGKRRRR